MNCIKF